MKVSKKLVEEKLTISMSDARRVIAQGGVFINGNRVDEDIEFDENLIENIRVGKTKTWTKQHTPQKN